MCTSRTVVLDYEARILSQGAFDGRTVRPTAENLLGEIPQRRKPLWEAFKNLSQARNSFVHRGYAAGLAHAGRGRVGVSGRQRLVGKPGIRDEAAGAGGAHHVAAPEGVDA